MSDKVTCRWTSEGRFELVDSWSLRRTPEVGRRRRTTGDGVFRWHHDLIRHFTIGGSSELRVDWTTLNHYLSRRSSGFQGVDRYHNTRVRVWETTEEGKGHSKRTVGLPLRTLE